LGIPRESYHIFAGIARLACISPLVQTVRRFFMRKDGIRMDAVLLYSSADVSALGRG